MAERCLYLSAVVAVGWAVTFALRALPFALFARRGQGLPKWVEPFSAVVSPIIIAGLVVYSYSGLEWRTPWPYLAGALTVALHLWRGNALASIVAGTVVYMALLSCGCVSDRSVDLDSATPSVQVKPSGIYFEETRVSARQVVSILDRAGVPHDRSVHILVSDDLTDLREARMLMGVLCKAGYTRPILVTRRHAESEISSRDRDRLRNTRPGPARKRSNGVRMKRANE